MSKSFPGVIDGVFQKPLDETKLMHNKNVFLHFLDWEGD